MFSCSEALNGVCKNELIVFIPCVFLVGYFAAVCLSFFNCEIGGIVRTYIFAIDQQHAALVELTT